MECGGQAKHPILCEGIQIIIKGDIHHRRGWKVPLKPFKPLWKCLSIIGLCLSSLPCSLADQNEGSIFKLCCMNFCSEFYNWRSQTQQAWPETSRDELCYKMADCPLSHLYYYQITFKYMFKKSSCFCHQGSDIIDTDNKNECCSSQPVIC